MSISCHDPLFSIILSRSTLDTLFYCSHTFPSLSLSISLFLSLSLSVSVPLFLFLYLSHPLPFLTLSFPVSPYLLVLIPVPFSPSSPSFLPRLPWPMKQDHTSQIAPSTSQMKSSIIPRFVHFFSSLHSTFFY